MRKSLHSRVVPTRSRRIVVSGLGLISPLGHGAWPTFRALLGGATIGDRAVNLPEDTAAVDLVRAVGCVRIAQHTPSDPAIELAERAAREALADAGVDPRGLCCIVGAGKGAVHALTAALLRQLPTHRHRCLIPSAVSKPVLPKDAELAVVLGAHGYLSHHLRKRLCLAEVRSVVAACASSLSALHQARHLLLHQRSDESSSVLVVTSEAALLPAFIHSYHRLGVLAPPATCSYRARPLDRRRRGFTLVEVGAAVVLETTDQTPKPGQIELVDTDIATEAHNMVRPAPAMTALRHVAARLLDQRRIDVLHPHATGTADHDPAELLAYRDSVKAAHHQADVYAIKGALGHGLGSSGLVSLIVACLCAKTNRRPPMPWLQHPITPPTNAVTITPTPHSREPLRSHAIFATGFGGHVAGAVVERVG